MNIEIITVSAIDEQNEYCVKNSIYLGHKMTGVIILLPLFFVIDTDISHVIDIDRSCKTISCYRKSVLQQPQYFHCDRVPNTENTFDIPDHYATLLSPFIGANIYEY